MDFDFPPPYDVEVPRRVGEARQELSPEGVAVLERLLAQADTPEDLVAALEPLPLGEANTILALNKLFVEAYDAAREENQGWISLFRQEGEIFRRAQELDPAFAARGASVTLGEAVAVLKRHGQPVGISDEVLEMIVEVPTEE